ncbi:Hpt domain-containing protein [Desulfococcaceae bacterium HSG7]|nr:Hpt domain-containing protein [Desulfococcaceae bacterium HSG7]
MDMKAAADSLGLDEEEFSEIVELFIDTAQSDIDKLKEGFDNGDTEKAANASHSLKGASGTLGFMDIYEIAKKAEEEAKDNDLDKLANSVAELNTCFEQLVSHFG